MTMGSFISSSRRGGGGAITVVVGMFMAVLLR
jgi:hypothetical protein